MKSHHHRDLRQRQGRILIAFAMTIVWMAATQTAVFAAKPPANRTYFTVLVGVDAPFSWQASCLQFTPSQLCFSVEDCGPWKRTEPGPDGAISFEIEVDAEGAPVLIEGLMRFETRGKKEAIGGTAHANLGGEIVNFALAGRSTSPSKCTTLMEEWIDIDQ